MVKRLGCFWMPSWFEPTSTTGAMRHSLSFTNLEALDKSVWTAIQYTPGDPGRMERETAESGAWRILGSPCETVQITLRLFCLIVIGHGPHDVSTTFLIGEAQRTPERKRVLLEVCKRKLQNTNNWALNIPTRCLENKGWWAWRDNSQFYKWRHHWLWDHARLWGVRNVRPLLWCGGWRLLLWWMQRSCVDVWVKLWLDRCCPSWRDGWWGFCCFHCTWQSWYGLNFSTTGGLHWRWNHLLRVSQTWIAVSLFLFQLLECLQLGS